MIIVAKLENHDSMTRFHITVILFAAYCLSCSQRPDVHAGFTDEPQGTVVFDFEEYALPASDIELYDVERVGNRYYCRFAEMRRSSWGPNSSPDHLFSFSLRDRNPQRLPLPEEDGDLRFIFQRGDSLFASVSEKNTWDKYKYYCFDPKAGKWNSYDNSASFSDCLYDDDEWVVRYVDHGEFGAVMWFIDKRASKEYAFWGLRGKVHRIGGIFYVVGGTRVYEIADPTVGFLCDSTTTYEKVRDQRLMGIPFVRAGYSSRELTFMPIVKYDDQDLLMDEVFMGDIVFLGGFGVWEGARADTLISGSFQSGGRLHCLLDTPSATVLTRWEDGRMTTLHELPVYEDVDVLSTIPDPARPEDETLLVLAQAGKGSYDLYEMGEDGNTLLRLTYKHGLEAIEQDGFATLFGFLLDNWGKLSFDEVVQAEESLGAKVSIKGLEAYRNSYPPQDVFSPEETYHIDILSKQIGETYYVDSEYWVADSDSTVPAVFLNWREIRPNRSGFDRSAKVAEIDSIITRRCGLGRIIPPLDRKQGFTEWHSDSQTIQLYNDVRLVIY